LRLLCLMAGSNLLAVFVLRSKKIGDFLPVQRGIPPLLLRGAQERSSAEGAAALADKKTPLRTKRKAFFLLVICGVEGD